MPRLFPRKIKSSQQSGKKFQINLCSFYI
jgi:hypothetical protein